MTEPRFRPARRPFRVNLAGLLVWLFVGFVAGSQITAAGAAWPNTAAGWIAAVSALTLLLIRSRVDV